MPTQDNKDYCFETKEIERFEILFKKIQVINVDPNKKPEENMLRTEIQSPEYTQIVFYDHYTRRK